MIEKSNVFSKLFLIVLMIKVFDIIKNLIIASVVGVSANADIYTSLISIPDSMIVLLGLDTIRGVVNSEYAHFYTKGKTAEMWESFNNLFNLLFWISILVVSVFVIFNSQIISLLLPGFTGEKKLRTVEISYIIFPILFFKVFTGYFHSVFNSIKSFYFPVVSPIIISVLLLISVYLPFYNNDVIFNLSIANLIGNCLLFIIMITALLKVGGFIRFKKIYFDPITLKVIKGSSSILILVLCNQLFLFSKNFFASYFGDGAVSALHYSGTITSVIISLIFAVYFTPLISNLSSYFSEEKTAEARTLFLHTLIIIFFLILPAVFFLIIYSREILSLVFLRGNFNRAGIEMTLQPYFWDVLSLFSFLLYIIPTALFLAKKEYKILTKIGSIVYICGIILNFFLSSLYGFYAVSIGTFITTGVYGILLLINSRNFIKLSFKDLNKFIFISLSGIISAGAVVVFKVFVFKQFISESFISTLSSLITGVILFSLLYLLISSFFKVNFIRQVLGKK